jgi:deoxyribodipyrimidine photolyase-like uncharacterized protein
LIHRKETIDVDPAKSVGEDPCLFTTLDWDFLPPPEALLANNWRMALPWKNIARIKPADRAAIQANGGASATANGLLAI